MNMRRRVVAGMVMAAVVGVLASVGAAAGSTADEMPVLLYGLVQLADTEDAITAEQAQQLLHIVQSWRMKLRLGISSSAHLNTMQVRAVLTATQLQRIDAMHLTTRYVELWTSEQTGVRLILRASAPDDDPPGISPTFMTVNRNEAMTSFADLVIDHLCRWAGVD